MSKPSDLVQGTLDLLLLKILALEPMHGWAIGQRLKQVSSDALQVSDGSLYPALHKLEQQRNNFFSNRSRCGKPAQRASSIRRNRWLR